MISNTSIESEKNSDVQLFLWMPSNVNPKNPIIKEIKGKVVDTYKAVPIDVKVV